MKYALLDASLGNHDSFALQLGTFRPIWGSTNTPFVKGAAYLRRIEAHTGQELAVAQLKGLKLYVWSIVLSFIYALFGQIVYRYMRIPMYEQLFELSAQHQPVIWYVGWESLIAEFFARLLSLCIMGHQFVACCRMAGFLALRNTWRPLEAQSIAEFWNRYYFYYKELLVDCFFYPAFMRYFKGYRRLRLYFATFAAACFGNAFYHFFRDLDYIEKNGFWKAIIGFDACLFYMVLLGIGICVSQSRQRPVRPNNSLLARILPSSFVILFFCVLRVFDYTDKRYPIQESFRFLGHLLNLGR